MAATDPTNFTREQIEALGGVISGNVGKAKVLTTADYNWPTTGTKTTVALWLLEPGMYYKINPNVDVKLYNSIFGEVGPEDVFIVGEHSAFGRLVTVLSSKSSDTFGRVCIISSSGSISYQVGINKPLNNLTTSSTGTALDANQGKVLKDLVDSLAIRGAGAPTTSTVGSVGTLYEDTTNGDLYICTDATNPYVWEEVGAGGSGPTVVQTTDSSAPTTATVGRLGQIQIDTTTATAYMCVAVDTVTPSYTWKKITA